MRISKEPEVRRQEILDVALKVFARKGYDETTMKDIAKEVNVATGLCYHYFQNKKVIYDTAVKQYARGCSSAFIEVFLHTELPLEECFNRIGDVWKKAENENVYEYERYFQESGNELFHKQLDLEMNHEILPYLVSYLKKCKERNEINVSNIEASAKFILNGQIAILNEEQYSLNQRFELVKELLFKVLK